MPSKIEEELARRRSERKAESAAIDDELVDRYLHAQRNAEAIYPRLRLLLHESPRTRAFRIERFENVDWTAKPPLLSLHFDVYDPYSYDFSKYKNGKVCWVPSIDDANKAITDATKEIVDYLDFKESHAATRRKASEETRKGWTIGCLACFGIVALLLLFSPWLR